MAAEARQHLRARATVPVEFHFAGTTGMGSTSDLSEGGLFVETETLASEGTRIYLRVHVPGREDDAPLDLIGIVRRRSDGAGGQVRGMGIRFEVAYARARESLGGFIVDALADPERVRDSLAVRASHLPDDAGAPPADATSDSAGGGWLWALGIALIAIAVLTLLR